MSNHVDLYCRYIHDEKMFIVLKLWRGEGRGWGGMIERFEDTKEVIRTEIRRRTENKMTKRKSIKITVVYKMLHRKLIIGQHKPR